MDLLGVNWLAVGIGTALAFGLGMIWFSPLLFGKAWAKGSHGISAPDAPPLAAMGMQLLGTFLLALVVGLTATTEALLSAILAISAAAVLQLASGLFSQKSTVAALIDGGFVVAMGIIMIGVQGLL